MDADVWCLIAEHWLRLRERDGSPRPGDDARRALVDLALIAPATAATCPNLLYLCGPQVREVILRAVAPATVSDYARVHKVAGKLLPRECALADATCSGVLAVAFRHDAPPQFTRRAGGRLFYDGLHLRDGYWRLCTSHHSRYDHAAALVRDRESAYAQAGALHESAAAVAVAGRSLWVSPAQAAVILGISTVAVRSALRSGRLAGQRTEAGWRVDAVDVARYKAAREAA